MSALLSPAYLFRAKIDGITHDVLPPVGHIFSVQGRASLQVALADAMAPLGDAEIKADIATSALSRIAQLRADFESVDAMTSHEAAIFHIVDRALSAVRAL